MERGHARAAAGSPIEMTEATRGTCGQCIRCDAPRIINDEGATQVTAGPSPVAAFLARRKEISTPVTSSTALAAIAMGPPLQCLQCRGYAAHTHASPLLSRGPTLITVTGNAPNVGCFLHSYPLRGNEIGLPTESFSAPYMLRVSRGYRADRGPTAPARARRARRTPPL